MNRELASSALADTMSAYRAFKRWHAWCDGLHAVKIASGLFEKPEYDIQLSISIEKTYLEANKRPRMPSKDRKHRMYSDVYRAASLAGVEVEPGSIGTLDNVFLAMTQVASKLATT